jgi:hypothetical protein
VPLRNGREPDESTLIRYLVGLASEEDTDQLDELSVEDEGFALRLRAVEHDLVDAYVNGELTGETLEGFKSQYLRTPSGLAAVELAEALRGYRRAPAAERQVAPVAATTHVAAPKVRARSWPWPTWGLAAAAAVFALLVASVYLLIDNQQLRQRVSGDRASNVALEQRARQLQEELTRQQAAARETEQELARAREALASGASADPGAAPGAGESTGRTGDAPRTGEILLALVLSPATRGGGQLPQFSIPPGVGTGADTGTGTVILRLPLVAVDFPHYEAALRDAAGDRIIWRSGRLQAPSTRQRPMIPVTIRTSLLGPRGYTLELTGISASGQAEPLDSYPFRVVP